MKTLLTPSFENLLNPVVKLRKTLTVHSGCKIVLLNTYEIIYLEGDGNYTYVYTVQGKRYLLSKTMKAIQTVLDTAFLRIHKSYTINPEHLAALIRPDLVLLSNGRQLPIARRRILAMQQMMAKHYLKAG